MATRVSRRVKDGTDAILALARDLQNQLRQTDHSKALSLDGETLKALDKYLGRLPLLTDAASAATRRQLDNEGTELWNICVQRMRTSEKNQDIVLLCKVKTLAYAMLEVAAPRTCSGSYRSLELAFKIARSCIDHGLVDLSQKIIESAASRLDMVEKSESGTETLKVETLAIEYYMLRIYLSWSQGRPDIADHLFSKTPKVKTKGQQMVVVDICYHVGNKALSLSQYDTATVWLGRALAACDSMSHDGSHEVDRGLKDKKLLVLHAFVRANFWLPAADSENQLQKALGLLRSDYGNSFPVLVAFLEVLSRENVTSQEYLNTLESSIKAMGSDDASVKIIYHYLQKLGPLNLEFFSKACGQLFSKLTLSDVEYKGQWMERIFISIIWTLTKADSDRDIFPDVAKVAVRQLVECGQRRLSEGAAHASLILIWKHIDLLLSKGSITVAEQWCRFVLQQDLIEMTPDTEAKFFQKLILCALEKYNPSAARKVFEGIPEVCKTCPLVLSLMYRLALLAEDTSLASAYLQSLSKLDGETTYVWSCIAHALQLGKLSIAMRNLEGLIAVSDDDCLKRLQVSELLQYVICFVCGKEDNTASYGHLIEQVVSLFESALKAAGQSQRTPFSSVELRWLSFQSYSIAFRSHKSSPLRIVTRLLKTATKLAELCQEDLEENGGLSEHYMRCNFLQATIIIAEARKVKNSTQKKTHYREARESTKQFQRHFDSQMDESIASTHPNNWLDKYRVILSYDFEAAVSLQQWNDIANIVEKSEPIVDIKLSSIFLDCILRSGAPSSYLSQIVKQMIRTLHSSPSPFLNTASANFNEHLLPRYLRCLFSLSAQAQEYVLAESVLDQAIILARNTRYPKDEVQWLATVAFNRAVEFFLVSADGDCRRWAEKAIALSDLVHDDRGELGRLLRGNLAKLALKE